jgi:thioredoxin-like negative regulator of GroEL
MKILAPRLIAILLLAAASPLTLRADLPPDWSTNYHAVLASSATNQAPLLLYFTASWCGPCKLMTRTTLADPAITRALAEVDHVALDIDEHGDLATHYGISAVPTFVLLSDDGEADRTTGYQPVEEFTNWLTKGLAKAHFESQQLAADKQTLAEVDQWLAAGESGSAGSAAAKLFTLCAGRTDAMVQAAAGRLKTLAAHQPLAVLDGLNDPRLACRIQAANALRSVLGDAFDVDPWADAAARQPAVEAWRGKLTKAPAAPAKQLP